MALELEYPIQILILIVTALVVVGIILNLQHTAINFKFPCFIPPCESQTEVKMSIASEKVITEDVLKKYCNLCWGKTGAMGYKKDVVCYIVKGSYSPIIFDSENCKLKCFDTVTSVFVSYHFLDKQVTIEC